MSTRPPIFALIVCVIFFSLLSSCRVNRFWANYETRGNRILYMGVENPIAITTNSIKKIRLSTDVGSVRQIDTDYYLIYPDTLPGTLNLKITAGKNEVSKAFKVEAIPNLNAFIWTKTSLNRSKTVAASEFQTFLCLNPVLANFDLDCRIALQSYKITRRSTDGVIKTENILDPSSAPNKATYLAEKAQTGDVYIFQEILVKIYSSNPALPGYFRKLDDVIIYIE